VSIDNWNGQPRPPGEGPGRHGGTDGDGRSRQPGRGYRDDRTRPDQRLPPGAQRLPPGAQRLPPGAQRSGGAHDQPPRRQPRHPDDTYERPQRQAPRRFYREPAETILDLFASPAAGWAVFRSYGPFLVVLPALMVADRLWVSQLLLVLLLLVFPGVLLLRALRVPGDRIAAAPVYVPAASLAVLIVSGLAVDIIGSLVGIHQPLRPVPLICGLELFCLALMYAATKSPTDAALRWGRLNFPLRYAWLFILPVLAVAGAQRLNNGRGSATAILAVCLCVVVFIWALVRAHRMGKILLMLVIYTVSLTLMWGYSLRGTLVYGFDISTEYDVAHQTVLAGVWHLSHAGDAYGALPSVTVLPAELHFLTGISDLMILKLVYPLIAALFPVGIFSFSCRFLRDRWAFAAVAFVVTQAAFGQEVPALARQEIALIFFIAMIIAMYDTGLSRRLQWTLTAVFGVGMAISHYSTVYFAIGMLFLLVLMQWLVSLRRHAQRVVGAFAVALIAATASAALWYGPITKSSSNLSQFIASVQEAGPALFESNGGPFGAASTDVSITPAIYQKDIKASYEKTRRFVTPFPDANESKYALAAAQPAPTPSARLAAVNTLLNLGNQALAEIAELIAACAAIYIALRKKTPPAVREVFLFGIGTLLELLIMRVSPTFAQAYNQPRAMIQGFAVLGIPLMWPLQHFAGQFRRFGKTIIAVGVLALVVIFVGNSGLSGALLGGSAATNLADSGEDYQRYYVTAPEVAAAQWLSARVTSGDIVYADSYGELRLSEQNVSDDGLLNDITPATLNQRAWIYATTTNVVDGSARVYFNNDEVAYAFPFGFLDSHYDVVFSDGSSEVFNG
jgi:uncharacterized membrane protein